MNTIEKPRIRLDSEHRYWLGDREVPGFSAICTDLGIIKPSPFYTEAGREEGNALHSWLIFLSMGQEPSEPPDERIAGRVEGIRKFLAESGFKFEGGEEPQYHAGLDFACTPDLWGALGGARCVIDAKRGGPLPWHALQLSAQKIALEDNGIYCHERYGLYLRNGGYRLMSYKDTRDGVRWLSIVAAYKAKKHYGGA